MVNKREFKTESKRLLDLMINSIYTHKEIFLRELISNASDAIDKYNFKSITDDNLETGVQYNIELILNKDSRKITIVDNGIGMTEEELIDNLGTIAKSGSKAFVEMLKEAQENNNEVDIIGQFGVGFYSAFMVANKIIVKTKSPYSELGYSWTSTGEDTYEIDKINKENHGTEITIYLRDNEDENYDDYLQEWKIKELVKKYSDYIRYPIIMDVEKTEPKYDDEGKIIEGEYNTFVEKETLNSMVPIWKKSKNEVTDEELFEFYKYQFHDYEEPFKVINTSVEGTLTYNALIYIPKHAPQDLYSDKYEKGLQLYSKGVFIMDKCKELVPDYLRFVKGLVDSPDLSLNISREILQHNKQLSKIASNLEKKILKELERMLKNDREKYIEFIETFGVNIKYGIYDQFGSKKDSLKDLIMFKSSKNGEYTTLKEYIEKMHIDQEFIYYASGSNLEQIKKLPQMELLNEKGYEVLIFIDDIDEFAINVLMDFEGKKFKSVNQGDLNLETEEEKQQLEEKVKESQNLLDHLTESLKDKVKEVRLSSRLKESPVCLVSSEGISFEMEKVMANMPNGNPLKAEKILEINPKHQLFTALETVYQEEKYLVADYADLLYSQALIIEGFKLEDPVAFSNKLCELMIKAAK